MRAASRALAFVVLLAVVLVPTGEHLPLDPDEPMAADGSLTAGRALTIFDFEPLLGAFGEREPRPDPDDPWNFKAYYELEWDWADRSRDPIYRVLGPIDWSFCEPGKHRQLIAAIRTYYDARGRQKASFSLRGPRATAFIEQQWSSKLDRRIDQFVRQLVEAGFLLPAEVPARSYREFAKVAADVRPIGKACLPAHAGRL